MLPRLQVGWQATLVPASPPSGVFLGAFTKWYAVVSVVFVNAPGVLFPGFKILSFCLGQARPVIVSLRLRSSFGLFCADKRKNMFQFIVILQTENYTSILHIYIYIYICSVALPQSIHMCKRNQYLKDCTAGSDASDHGNRISNKKGQGIFFIQQYSKYWSVRYCLSPEASICVCML